MRTGCGMNALKRARKISTITVLLLAETELQTYAASQAGTAGTFEERKTHAEEVYRQGKFVEALSLFESLHAENPGDLLVLERLSFSTLGYSATLTDANARRDARVKARKLATEAKAAGDESNLVKVVLDVPEDGSESSFSNSPEIEAIMREGEAAFAKGDYENAIGAYTRALVIEPQQYSAALFLGDVYFKKGVHAQAGEWFLKAIQIDPNRETAYRYWGDDLVAQGKNSEAKEQFLKAVVAQPYERISWMGLSQWAQKQKLTLKTPAINPPGRVEDKGKNEKGQSQTSIIIDMSTLNGKNNQDGTDTWFIYTLSKATWHGDSFHKAFPNEKEYRHSLAEELNGFQMVVSQVKEKLNKKEIKRLDPELSILVKLSDEGLLEAYILIARADAGIAKDYAGYRDSHPEKIAQFISDWMIQPAP